jgi:plasmid stability protein
VKNITVSVNDETYRKARIRAAETGTSVSAMVSQFLEALSADESDFDRRKRLQHDTLAGIRAFRAADRLPRDEVHDRRAVR